jgi:hypothetical protein
MNFYIEPGLLQESLIKNKLFTIDTVPTMEQIEDRARECEYLIEEWLGYDPLVREYIETEYLDQSTFGITLKRRYVPVISVNKLLVQDAQDNNKYYPLTREEIDLVWDGSRIITFKSVRFRCNYFSAAYPYAGKPQKIVIHYTAGYSPLPDRFKMAFKSIFLKSFQEGMEWFAQPVIDVQSIGVSGVSKSLRLGKGAEGEPGTNLDRILSLYLKKHRQHYIY